MFTIINISVFHCYISEMSTKNRAKLLFDILLLLAIQLLWLMNINCMIFNSHLEAALVHFML